VEHDPEALVACAADALRDALATAGAHAREAAALGIASQRATALAWDAPSGRPLAPALGWQDQRTAAAVARLRARGIPATTQASATKWAWLLREVPEVAEAARAGRLCLGTPDAWLTARLSAAGAAVTDPGHASCTGLWDPRGGGWSPEAAALFEVPPEALPPLAATAEVAGETATALLGAPVPLAARAGDQQAAAFAQGVHAEGEAKLTLGTAAMLDVHTGARPRGRPGAFPLALWRVADAPTQFCVEGTVLTAGAVVEWLVALGVLRRAEDLDALAGSVASSEGVVLVPAFQGLGTPWLHDGARGLAVGLTRGTTAAHLARAALDGIAHRCVDAAEALEVAGDALPVDGGLAGSDLLCATLADLLGRPVERAAEPETTALGAALLGGLAVGRLPDAAACRALAEPPRRFEPRLDAAGRAARRARFAQALERARAHGEEAQGQAARSE
jgi:glycerol kinase